MLLTYICLNGEGPKYLKDLLSLHTPKDSLRSASQEMLQPKRFKLDAFGKGAFCHAALSYTASAKPQVAKDDLHKK